MKITQLIESLEKVKEEHGDLGIWVSDEEDKEIILVTINSAEFLPGKPSKYASIIPMKKVGG